MKHIFKLKRRIGKMIKSLNMKTNIKKKLNIVSNKPE